MNTTDGKVSVLKGSSVTLKHIQGTNVYGFAVNMIENVDLTESTVSLTGVSDAMEVYGLAWKIK